MKKVLNRYLAKELFSSFLLGLVGFTLVLITGRILQLTELLVNKGIALFSILKLLALLLPSFLVLTIPMATLLAVLLTFNRLSSDNEITALKASGVSLYQLTPVVLVLSFMAYLAATLLSLYTLPRANHASHSLLYQMASSKAHAGVKERVFNDDFAGLVLYVDRVAPQGLKWEGVFISDSRNPAEIHTIIARDGVVLSEPKLLTVTLKLKNGSIHKLGKQPEAYQKIDFYTYDLNLDLMPGWKEKQDAEKNPSDMSLSELRQAIQTLRSKNADVKTHQVKVQGKFSIPFACLVFGIMGIPLGIQSRPARAGKSMGFAISIGILLVYYFLTNAGTSLAERGILPLEVGMWAPNAIFLGLGIYLLIKAAKESPVLLFVWLNERIERLRKGWGSLWRSGA